MSMIPWRHGIQMLPNISQNYFIESLLSKVCERCHILTFLYLYLRHCTGCYKSPIVANCQGREGVSRTDYFKKLFLFNNENSWDISYPLLMDPSTVYDCVPHRWSRGWAFVEPMGFVIVKTVQYKTWMKRGMMFLQCNFTFIFPVVSLNAGKLDTFEQVFNPTRRVPT